MCRTAFQHLHTVTLRMDRMFDVQPDAFSGNICRTLFSFESDGKRYFSVLVNGEPRLQSGQTITAVLRCEGDWQTVMGMRVHETGEVCAPRVASTAPLLVGIALTVFLTTLELQHSYLEALVPVLAAHGLGAAICVHNAIKSIRIRRALRAAG